MGSLHEREVACSASALQGLNFESCVWRALLSHSSHHPQEVLLAQFSLYVPKSGIKPDSFHFISCNTQLAGSFNDCFINRIAEIRDTLLPCLMDAMLHVAWSLIASHFTTMLLNNICHPPHKIKCVATFLKSLGHTKAGSAYFTRQQIVYSGLVEQHYNLNGYFCCIL